MAECPFCTIAAGDADTSTVLSEPAVVAILDHRPVFKGHVLVLPRHHIPTLTDLPTGQIGPFFRTVQRVAAAVQSGLAADGTFVAMNNTVSQSVPHLHVHVVPRRRKDGLRGFFWPRTRYASDGEIAEYAARITAALDPPTATS